MYNSKHTISVIMPALNEESNIEAAVGNTLKAFDDFKIDGEIIIINDGSTDKTSELVTALIKKDNRLRMISHDAPKGIGASFWEGVNNATGDVVSMFPGDNENDPWETLRYFELLDHVDIVIPFVFNKEVRSFFRNTLSFIYRFIINTTFLVYFNYTNGTIIYRRSILKDINHISTGFFFQTDILIRTVKKGYIFAEVPYHLNTRNTGISKAVSFPSLLEVIKGYLELLKDNYSFKSRKEKTDFPTDTLTGKRFKHDDRKANP